MLDKTKLMFKKDVGDLYILYNRFNRLKRWVISYFEKFITGSYVDKISYSRGMFRFQLKTEEGEDDSKRFDEIIEILVDEGFEPAFSKGENVFYIHIENIQKVVLSDEY